MAVQDYGNISILDETYAFTVTRKSTFYQSQLSVINVCIIQLWADTNFRPYLFMTISYILARHKYKEVKVSVDLLRVYRMYNSFVRRN